LKKYNHEEYSALIHEYSERMYDLVEFVMFSYVVVLHTIYEQRMFDYFIV